jgi:hypothetical protein
MSIRFLSEEVRVLWTTPRAFRSLRIGIHGNQYAGRASQHFVFRQIMKCRRIDAFEPPDPAVILDEDENVVQGSAAVVGRKSTAGWP